MTNFKKQLFAATAAGSLLLSVVAPLAAYADTTIVISGNGQDSNNTTSVTTVNTTTVAQNNVANVTNNVDSNANSGGNDANDNAGNVGIHTGDATAKANVSNDLNRNAAEVNCCAVGDTKVSITGNGQDSDNLANLAQVNTNTVTQGNLANVTNNVDVDAKTGYNDANDNSGSVLVHTGDAKAVANVSTHANTNAAKIGGGNGGQSGNLLAVISGNIEDSDNTISLGLTKANTIFQNNVANVTNNVDADAKTGKNDANDNTLGIVGIHTGDATTRVDVDNSVNFNAAEIDCGCLTDVKAKVEGNGEESDNVLSAALVNANNVWQGGKDDYGNHANLRNYVDGDAKSGYNDANDNGGVSTDPYIWTGDDKSVVHVSNSGNVNEVGNLEMPFFDWGWDFGPFHFWGM